MIRVQMTVPPELYFLLHATLISAATTKATPALMTKPQAPKSGEGINGATVDAAADVSSTFP